MFTPPARATRRSQEGLLMPQAREELDASLTATLNARRQLRDDMLADTLEAHTFGVHHGNVRQVLESRLSMLETVKEKIPSLTSTESVNERPLASLGLSVVDLWKGYIPLATLIRQKWLDHRSNPSISGAFCIGINAEPGSGKSTLVQVLLFLLSASSERDLRVVQVGSDDLYMGKTKRLEHGVSTRLDPRSLDPSYFDIVRRLKNAAAGESIELPRFNKGLDDRERGSTVVGPFDIVLYEGWRVGVAAGELNGSNFDYSELNSSIDFLMYLDADPEAVLEWKIESSRRDHEREKPDEPWSDEHVARLKRLWVEWIRPFMEQHERPLAFRASGGADLVVTKDSAHHIMKVDLRAQLREYYDAHADEMASPESAAKALSAAFGRGNDAHVILERSRSFEASKSASVSFDAFAETAEQLLETSGQLAQLSWHQYITCLPYRAASTEKAGSSNSFQCASVRVTTDESAALLELVHQLGGVPSFVAVYTNCPEAMERCAQALAADSTFASTAVQGCTSCLGSVASAASETQEKNTVIFGVRDAHGTYCCAAKGLDQLVKQDASVWYATSRSITKEALEHGMNALCKENQHVLPLVFLHATPGYEEHVLAGIQNVLPGAKVFGGSAADREFNSDSWRLLSGNETICSSGVAICLMWPSVSYSLSLNCLHESPLAGAATSTVDEVGDAGRLLLSLDGRPAALVYDELCGCAGDDQAEEALNTRTTLNPFARKVVDNDGQTMRYFPLHPRMSCGSKETIELFASVKTGEELVCLHGTHQGIVDAVGVAVAQSATKRASGALAIYCAGCALELDSQPDFARTVPAKIGSEISKSLPLGCPFAGCFTFGEQGPLLHSENVHANLMFNLLIFGVD